MQGSICLKARNPRTPRLLDPIGFRLRTLDQDHATQRLDRAQIRGAEFPLDRSPGGLHHESAASKQDQAVVEPGRFERITRPADLLKLLFIELMSAGSAHWTLGIDRIGFRERDQPGKGPLGREGTRRRRGSGANHAAHRSESLEKMVPIKAHVSFLCKDRRSASGLVSTGVSTGVITGVITTGVTGTVRLIGTGVVRAGVPVTRGITTTGGSTYFVPLAEQKREIGSIDRAIPIHVRDAQSTEVIA